MKGRSLALGALVLLGVVSYVWWLHLTRTARALGQASAIVTLSDARADCAVRRNDGKQGERVPCDEVGVYLRDKLVLRPGASVGITVLGKVTPDAVAAVAKELTADGFKVAGVVHVGFISKPGGAR